jgi:dephospho-CoA kinase
MLRVGLTGGIGCGKSTVASMLRELGCAVIDADLLAHKLIETGRPAYEEVVREFGTGILDPQGQVDRGKLAAVVFEDSRKLQRLNHIVHPRVIEIIERQLAEAARNGAAVAVVEAALLVEGRYHEQLDRLVVVWCRPEQQRERLRLRGMSPEQIDKRINAQMPAEQKRRVATDEIDNSGSIEETRQQVERLADKLKRLAA